MDWNKVNKDLLAVGYAQSNSKTKSKGCVAFWSLKNPNYPEQVIIMERSVTAVDFGTEFPHLLAVGKESDKR